jgi:hypothetical protein
VSTEHKPGSVSSIPDDVARTVFDIAVGSLDFGSGFLDNDGVHALRAFARAIGVDEAKATPENFTCVFYPPHEWSDWRPVPGSTNGSEGRLCQKCQHYESRRP